MQCVSARSASGAALTAKSSLRVASIKPCSVSSCRSLRLPARKASSSVPARRVAAQALPVEVAQIAGEAGFITGTALVMFAITLVGLAVGFVLLRVEALVEEGKL